MVLRGEMMLGKSIARPGKWGVLAAPVRLGVRLATASVLRTRSTIISESLERGQVLIIVALAGTALMGFLALAVDIGNLYFQRRAAQDAADAAALVGAQDVQGVIPNVTLVTTNAVKDARQYAINNGFKTDSGANNGVWNQEVRVDVPPATGPYAGQPDYIEVRVQRNLNTLFAGVLGVQLKVSARAVARAKHQNFEVATLSLDPGDPSTWVNGSGNVNVVGSTYSRGETQNISGVLHATRKAYSRGGFEGTISADEGLVNNPPDLFDPGWSQCGPIVSGPGVSWNSNGIVEKSTMDPWGYEWINPGTYDWISVSSSYKVKFNPGVYRVTRSQGVTINGGAESAGPVCFVLDDGATFNIQANSGVYLYSGPAYNNIIIWSADDSQNAVKIAGGNDVTLLGTLYVPKGTARLAGSATGTVRGQVVADNIILEGTTGTTVVYDPNNAAETPGPALVE
ncbi:MAG: hypothetical protein HYY30_07225 [Chloroflexi bacterium]|nr:hypothetical protein [Chloroflexota bacterium]